ncbi:MAG: RidA family protein [Alphaproteobacteria bacterium]|nr:RidA family protein [Alphaproteobacteria bacterium]
MKRHLPPELAPPLARYVHAVEIATPGRMLFASGQLAIARDGSVPAGIEAQCDLIFANLDAILRSAGMGRGDVVRVNAFVIDRDGLKPYMAARDRWFAGHEPPASTLMMVAGFTRPEFKVEIEIVAAREAKP